MLFVGDHETDARCAQNADQALAEQRIPLHVVTVGAFFDGLGSDGSWSVRPDYRACSPADVVTIVEGLRESDQR